MMKHDDEVHRGPHLKDAKSREGKSQSLRESFSFLLNRKSLRAHVGKAGHGHVVESMSSGWGLCESQQRVEGTGGLSLPGACQTLEHISLQSNSEMVSDLLSLNLSSLWI